MSKLEEYVRKQEMLTNLKFNLVELHKDRINVLDSLLKVEQMILKHENFIKILEEEDEES